jgi:hypothetical protein
MTSRRESRTASSSSSRKPQAPAHHGDYRAQEEQLALRRRRGDRQDQASSVGVDRDLEGPRVAPAQCRSEAKTRRLGCEIASPAPVRKNRTIAGAFPKCRRHDVQPCCRLLVGCKNCGGYFTSDEVQRRKPPLHPWRLTAVGARSLAANTARGANSPCPTCGQNTLGSAPPPPSQFSK